MPPPKRRPPPENSSSTPSVSKRSSGTPPAEKTGITTYLTRQLPKWNQQMMETAKKLKKLRMLTLMAKQHMEGTDDNMTQRQMQQLLQWSELN